MSPQPSKGEIIWVWQLRWLLATIGDAIRTAATKPAKNGGPGTRYFD